MARIAGVDIPKQKRGVIALTYIFGIGKSRAKKILEKAGVDENKKVTEWMTQASRAFQPGQSNRKMTSGGTCRPISTNK